MAVIREVSRREINFGYGIKLEKPAQFKRHLLYNRRPDGMLFFNNEAEAITYIFRSLRRLRGQERGLDEYSRDVGPTRRLLMATNLINTPREYAVVTGSKGKGSTTVITAKLLQHLGHKVGMITSPHLVSWRERIRVDGRAIPEADLLRILSDLAPHIDEIDAHLNERQYFSPQGIFLAIALQWFDEQGVQAAVLEVGRGGRFDDISVVPNKLSLFSPIMLEHPDQLGPTLERIAWHKAGIIKSYSYAYSLPQPPEVLHVLQTEADRLGAEFNWIAPKDIGEYLETTDKGIRMNLGRYGDVTLSLIGRYQVANATLAVIGAGNMHGRMQGIPHGSPEYIERIRTGLANVVWPGRCQKLQDHPAVYVDGAINAESVSSLVESLVNRFASPVISIIGVPSDKDYQGVYSVLGQVSQAVILTETTRNPSLHFLSADEASAAARAYNPNISYATSLAQAVDQAKQQAGTEGTILIVGTQSIVSDAVNLWGESYEVI
jgi:dihydrofolate synthase/folylpolyglutamate synthase